MKSLLRKVKSDIRALLAFWDKIISGWKKDLCTIA